jgi:hypothetical protein
MPLEGDSSSALFVGVGFTANILAKRAFHFFFSCCSSVGIPTYFLISQEPREDSNKVEPLAKLSRNNHVNGSNSFL